MANVAGTFPYKLWDLINSAKDNGIEWTMDGTTIIIDKKLFQRKCLNKKRFKTSNFLSITKQLNVYGFVQQAHRFSTRQFLAYRHKNFQQGHPELLQNFCRRINSSSKTTSVPKFSSPPEFILSSNKTIDAVMLARLNFRHILQDNVNKLLQLLDQTSSTESDSSIEIFTTQPLYPAPPRQDPRFLMWNGSLCKEARGLNENNMNTPNTSLSNSCLSTKNPKKPLSNDSPQCNKAIEELTPEKDFLNFTLEMDELEEIYLDDELKVISEETVCTTVY